MPIKSGKLTVAEYRSIAAQLPQETHMNKSLAFTFGSIIHNGLVAIGTGAKGTAQYLGKNGQDLYKGLRHGNPTTHQIVARSVRKARKTRR